MFTLSSLLGWSHTLLCWANICRSLYPSHFQETQWSPEWSIGWVTGLNAVTPAWQRLEQPALTENIWAEKSWMTWSWQDRQIKIKTTPKRMSLCLLQSRDATVDELQLAIYVLRSALKKKIKKYNSCNNGIRLYMWLEKSQVVFRKILLQRKEFASRVVKCHG